MSVVIYDGSFDGLLTGVFEIYALKLDSAKLQTGSNQSQSIFEEPIVVTTDEAKSQRVQKPIKQYLGDSGLKSFWKASLTEDPEVGQLVYQAIRYMLIRRSNVLADFGHPAILGIQKLLKKISRESHRMTAFVRFELGSDDIYYAQIEPDFDVLPVISKHFQNRYADQKWLIYDSRRKYGIFYNLQEVYPITLTKGTQGNLPIVGEITLEPSEKQFQELWRQYFKATNITSRKNTKLHLQHVPKRYWKLLTEKK
jgi:probable DNA metabolism protein